MPYRLMQHILIIDAHVIHPSKELIFRRICVHTCTRISQLDHFNVHLLVSVSVGEKIKLLRTSDFCGASEAGRHLGITLSVVCPSVTLLVCLKLFYLQRYGFHIWHVCSLCQYLSDGIINFDHVTLTVTFDLHLENFNSAHISLNIRLTTFILGKCVFLWRPFRWYHKLWSRDLDRDLWPIFGKL